MSELFELCHTLKARMTIRNSWTVKDAYDVLLESDRGIQRVSVTVTREFTQDANFGPYLVVSIKEQWEKQTK